MPTHPVLSPPRDAFTLVESLIALTIVGLAGAAVLVALETSLETSTDSYEQTIAAGMAEQLIDEVMSTMYLSPGGDPYQYPLCPNTWEIAGNGRERFNDTDDFNGFVAVGAEDIWGNPMGAGDGEGGLRHESFRVKPDFFEDWRQEIDVYYVSDDDPSQRLPAYQTSNHRAVEVRISRAQANGAYRTLATAKRVYAYIPQPGGE